MLNFLKFQFIKSLVAVRSVVMVAGICSSVGGIVFFDMPQPCWWRIPDGVKAKVVN